MKSNPILSYWCLALTFALWTSLWIAVQAHNRIRDLEETVRELSHRTKP